MEDNLDKMLEEIQHEINMLEGKKSALVQNFVFENEAKLFGEVLDLFTRTDIVPEDSYASERKYSTIPGIKNLRVWEKGEDSVLIAIKVYDKKGEYFAKFWEAQKVVKIGEYNVSFCCRYSRRYYE